MLRPLQRITATAKRVSQDNLDERIALEGPRDELKELADTFDGMLERLSGAFASQRRFVANASHELRTPLTVIRTELDVTLADPHATNADLRAMGETVRDATLATERLIQALLTLARSEGGVTRRDPVDLADCARTAVAQAGAEANARGLEMHPALEPAPVRGDRRLLERLVANLVENAVRHNVDGGAVEVRDGERRGAQHGRGAQRRAGRAARRGQRRCSSPSSASTAARAATASASGSRSCAPSPRRTAARWSCARARPADSSRACRCPRATAPHLTTDFIQGDYADDRARAHA